jgi:hypothetical protein
VIDLLLRRDTMVLLAIAGAASVVIGSAVGRRSKRTGYAAVCLGYGLTAASVALFIAAGFLGR